MLPGTAALPILTRCAPIIIGNDFCQALPDDLMMLFSSRICRRPFALFMLHYTRGRELPRMTIGLRSDQARTARLAMTAAISIDAIVIEALFD